MIFSICLNSDGATVVTIAGELDVTTKGDLERALNELVAARAPRVEIDLSQLRMIDSIGIGLLVGLYKCARDRGGEVVLREAAGQPLALFRLLQLDRLMMGTTPSSDGDRLTSMGAPEDPRPVTGFQQS
jgi:anti-sigma B factor antagonist